VSATERRNGRGRGQRRAAQDGGQGPVRVALVDDAPEVRQSLASALGQLSQIEIVGHAADGVEAIELVEREQPQVVIMDLKMPRMDGIKATRHVVSRLPDTAVLVLSAYGDESLVIEALMAGARGYLLKGTRATELAEAIVSAAGGQARIAGPVTRPVLERLVDALARERETRQAAEEARLASERLSQRQQQFVTMAAHELRTPVTALIGSLATLERLLGGEGRLDPAELDLLFASSRQARRLSRLIEDLTVVAENGSAGITVKPKAVELEQAITGVVGDLEHLGADRVKITCAAGLVAFTDPVRLAQVLTNLIRNALQYSPPETPVEAIASAAPRCLEIAVADRGPGIPEEEVEHLFDRFGRESYGPTTGLGVGLWTVRELLNAMNGKIEVERNQEGGATFRIQIPAAEAPQPRRKTVQSRGGRSGSAEPKGKR
jgi:signal transduction histidine kinase